jgi:signal transduction histidine kinase
MRELEAIGELTTAMVTHHDMQTLLTALVTKSTDLLEGQAGILFLSDAEKGLLRVVVSYKSKKQYEGMTIAYGEGAAGIVAQSGEALIINDYRSWEGRLQPFKAEPISALLSVPLARQGQVVGVICISRGPKQPPFTAHDLKLLGLFANHAVVMLENARLIEDVQSRATQLEKLNQLGRLAIAVTDMQGLLDVVVREMRDLVGADGCGITIWDEEHQRAEAAATSASLSGIWEEEGVAESATALTDAVLHSRTPLYVASMQKAAHVDAALARRYPDTSILVLPMVVGEESLGAIFLIRKEGMGLGRDEISLCGQATGQVALAMAKIRALEAERKRSSELEALGKASLSLTSSLELHEVLHTIIGQTFSMVKADDVHTFLYDGEMLTFGAAQWAGGRHGKPYSEPRSNGITYTVARAGEAIVVPDVNAHPLYDGYEWGGAIAGFPLKIDGRVVGVMNVAFSQPHEFDTAELRAIELLADQAAIAVRNAHLFGTVDDERRRVQLLYDVTRELSQILDPQELMQRAIALATDSLRGQAGEVFLLQPGTDRLKLEATAGWDNAEIDALDARLAMRVGKGITGWVAEYGQPALLEDVEKDGRWLFIEGVDEDVRSAVCAPIIAGERLLGVMNIVGREPFPKEHLNLLVAISRQVGLALSHAERYQELRKRLAELTVLQQVVHAITRRLEMKPLLEEVVRQAGEVLGYPIVQIFLVQEGRMATGAAWGESSYDTSTLSMNKGITGKAVMLDQAIYVPDVSKDPDYVMAYPGTRSEFAVPLRQGDVIFGVLNVESPDLAGFDEQDMRMLTLLADQVSVAIENAALYERLRKDADELSATVAERTAELADALEEAREAERLKGQFVSDVSHELRTPLSNIRLYLELLAKGKTEKYAIYLETLSRETERLVALIEDLLAISRLDADMVSPAPELLKLNVLVRGLAEDRQRLLAEKGLDLQLMLEPDLPPVVGDERMISQVLANLMTNAMNYTPAGGRVSISTSSEQRDGQIWATLTVADTGVGIPHEERPHLFQRFFRGSAGRQMGTPGTGLGLAICKEILDRHGGYITVVSEPGRGSAFTVLLPASAVVMATQGPRMRSAHPQARPSDL